MKALLVANPKDSRHHYVCMSYSDAFRQVELMARNHNVLPVVTKIEVPTALDTVKAVAEKHTRKPRAKPAPKPEAPKPQAPEPEELLI